MTSGHTAYITPEFDPSDPLVCRSMQLRPSLWTVVFNELQRLGQSWQWYQDDPAHATVQEVIAEINAATDAAVFAGCIMIGSVIDWPVDVLPDWVLLCDGTTYEDADYPELGAVIHANLRVDATHFRVPQRQARFALGGAAVGTQGGAATHTLTIAEMPAHQHSYIESTLAASIVLGDQAGLENDDEAPALTGSTGGGGAHNNMPPYEETQFVIIARYPSAG